MKNLRKKNPLYSQFKDEVHQPIRAWLELSHEDRIDLCVRFLLLPVIQKGKTLTPELIQTVSPSAVDLEHQATQFAQEQAETFTHIMELLEQTTRLFLLPEG